MQISWLVSIWWGALVVNGLIKRKLLGFSELLLWTVPGGSQYPLDLQMRCLCNDVHKLPLIPSNKNWFNQKSCWNVPGMVLVSHWNLVIRYVVFHNERMWISSLKFRNKLSCPLVCKPLLRDNSKAEAYIEPFQTSMVELFLRKF